MTREIERARVVFLAPGLDAFIKTDLQILQKHFDVHPVVWHGRSGLPRLTSKIISADAVFSWFAGDHSATASILASIRGIPSLLVSGGVDVAAMPEIGYGAMAEGMRKRLPTKLALNFSTLVLAFSDFSRNEISRAHAPRDLRTMYLGVDTHRFMPAEKKEEIVLTVGQVSKGNLKRKGLRAFVDAARRLPRFNFILAGRRVDDSFERIKTSAPPNLNLTGYLPDGELAGLIARSKVYVQASAHEGFGVALAEAMSCGCIPVVSDRGALPEVVGDAGLSVKYGDDEGLAQAINQAMTLPSSEGLKARERVQRNFSLEKREAGLKAAVEALVLGR